MAVISAAPLILNRVDASTTPQHFPLLRVPGTAKSKLSPRTRHASKMDSIQRQPSRPPTVWCDGTPDWATLKKPTHPSAPSSRPQPDPAATTSAPVHPEPAQLKDQDQAWNLQPVFQNPWLTYEAIVVISQGQSVFLARHRNNKVALVNITF